MKVACFIPVKENSERVPGKNFRMLNGKKLYQWICEAALEAEIFDDVFLDTNSNEVASWAQQKGIRVIERKPELAQNSANGNDLLNYQFELYPEYDYYFQCFATAPFLTAETIKKCVQILVSSNRYDSCFTGTEKYGFFWMQNHPINYRPGVLPRSQDLVPVIEETTGLYGISKEALARYHCRIGANPYVQIVSSKEATDINTEDDMEMARFFYEK